MDLRPPQRDDLYPEVLAVVDDRGADRDTIDPLAKTVPLDDLVDDALEAPTKQLPAPPPQALHPVRLEETPEVVAPAMPAAQAPTRPAVPNAPMETARLSALVSTRAGGLRASRQPGLVERRLRRLAAGAAIALLVAPWLAPLRTAERGVALSAGLVAALVAFSRPLQAGRAAAAVVAGVAAFAAWLALSTDLAGLGLALTTSLMVVLPGSLFHRHDRPDSPRGAALTAFGLALGAAWMLTPTAGGLLRSSLPPVLPREYATVALAPWLLLGSMALPRTTAAASGSPFAGGLLLWSGALAMLRCAALEGEMVTRWRVVAVSGVCAAALASLIAGGVARALDDEA